jgi:hypothetical protein
LSISSSVSFKSIYCKNTRFQDIQGNQIMLLKLVRRYNKTATIPAAATAEADVFDLTDEAPFSTPAGRGAALFPCTPTLAS